MILLTGQECRMLKWLARARNAVPDIALLGVVLLLSGCQGLPTLEVTATVVPTTQPTALVGTPTASTVQITGDVYVRDNESNVAGWLYKGDQVQAECSGDWCMISSGSFSGYYFWRGCSSDNPERKRCQAR
jgi:hypothetical protein